MAVHLFGQMADMRALSALATRSGLALVEDAAQAHGARFAGRRAGSWGAAAGFSFYPGKNLGALGDGGAVVSADPDLVGRIRRLAAVLHAKLTTLDVANRARAATVARYREVLPPWCALLAVAPDAEPVFHHAIVSVPDRAATTRALDAAGIGWGVHYPVPCHRQPAYAAYADGSLPVAEAAAERILSLPVSPTMTAEQVERVAMVLHRAGP